MPTEVSTTSERNGGVSNQKEEVPITQEEANLIDDNMDFTHKFDVDWSRRYSAEELSRLIRCKRQVPKMAWNKILEQEFPKKTIGAIQKLWKCLVKICPQVLDLKVSEDAISIDYLEKRYGPTGRWTTEEEMLLIETKRLHPDPHASWEEIKNIACPNRATQHVSERWAVLLKDNPNLLDRTAQEGPIISNASHSAPWNTEKVNRLIQVKKDHPVMSWKETRDKYFPEMSWQSCQLQWSKILKTNPELRRQFQRWTCGTKEEAILLDIKRSHPDWSWAKIQAESFPKVVVSTIQQKWNLMLDTNPNLLLGTGVVGNGASDVKYGLDADKDSERPLKRARTRSSEHYDQSDADAAKETNRKKTKLSRQRPLPDVIDETRKRTAEINELGIDTTSFNLYHGTMKDGIGDVTLKPAGTIKQGGKILWGSLPDPDNDAPRTKAISKVEHHFTENRARDYAKYTAQDLLALAPAAGWKSKDSFKRDTLINFLQNHDMKHSIPIVDYGGNILKRKRKTKNGYYGSGFVDIMPGLV